MKPLFEKARTATPTESAPTLLEAMLLCEQDDLVEALCKLLVLQENVSTTKGVRKQLRAHVQEACMSFERMRGLVGDSGAVLVIPREVFYACSSGAIGRFIKAQGVTATLFDMKTYAPADTAKATAHQLCIMPYSAVSLALLPWVYALSAHVHFPQTLCKAERYELLASAFWELTYFGCDEQSVEEGQKREHARRIKQGIMTPLMAEEVNVLCGDQIHRIEDAFLDAQALDLAGATWQNHLYQAHVAQSVIKLKGAAHERFLAEVDELKRTHQQHH